MKAVLAGIVIGILLAFVLANAVPYFGGDPSEDALKRAYERVDLGADADRGAMVVLGALAGQQVFASPEHWLVSARPRFFQDHWVLQICITSGKVVGKRIGMGDDPSVTPKGAPAPKGTCSA